MSQTLPYQWSWEDPLHWSLRPSDWSRNAGQRYLKHWSPDIWTKVIDSVWLFTMITIRTGSRFLFGDIESVSFPREGNRIDKKIYENFSRLDSVSLHVIFPKGNHWFDRQWLEEESRHGDPPCSIVSSSTFAIDEFQRNVFAESTGIIVHHCLSIAKAFQQWCCLRRETRSSHIAIRDSSLLGESVAPIVNYHRRGTSTVEGTI